MARIYDLHCHSSASDGILRPHDLVSRAKAQGVDVLALTDHDTLDGFHEAKCAAAETGLTLICGVEFSSQWRGRGIHIVGLNLDPESARLHEVLLRQQSIRDDRAQKIAARLEKCGVRDALAGAASHAAGAPLGRPHFARFLVERGHAKSVSAAFKQYLGSGKPSDVKLEWPEFDEVIAGIRAAGGAAVLAHPVKYALTRTRMRAMLTDFKAAGGVAMEVIAGQQMPQITADLARVAADLGLMASCGSDFHSPGQPWQELGRFGTLPLHCRPVWCEWDATAAASEVN